MPDRNPELVSVERLNLRNAQQVEQWTTALNVYVMELVEAVGEVGDSTHAVLGYILSKSSSRRGP